MIKSCSISILVFICVSVYFVNSWLYSASLRGSCAGSRYTFSINSMEPKKQPYSLSFVIRSAFEEEKKKFEGVALNASVNTVPLTTTPSDSVQSEAVSDEIIASEAAQVARARKAASAGKGRLASRVTANAGLVAEVITKKNAHAKQDDVQAIVLGVTSNQTVSDQIESKSVPNEEPVQTSIVIPKLSEIGKDSVTPQLSSNVNGECVTVDSSASNVVVETVTTTPESTTTTTSKQPKAKRQPSAKKSSNGSASPIEPLVDQSDIAVESAEPMKAKAKRAKSSNGTKSKSISNVTASSESAEISSVTPSDVSEKGPIGAGAAKSTAKTSKRSKKTSAKTNEATIAVD